MKEKGERQKVFTFYFIFAVTVRPVQGNLCERVTSK